MGHEGQGGEGQQWQSAAIVAAAAGFYSTISGANKQDCSSIVGRCEWLSSHTAGSTASTTITAATTAGGQRQHSWHVGGQQYDSGHARDIYTRGHQVLEQCHVWGAGKTISWAQITIFPGRIPLISIIRGRQGEGNWRKERRRCKGAAIWTRAKLASTKCRELEGRRWTWRHAATIAQQRGRIGRIVFAGEPDRNTAEWPPDVRWCGRGPVPSAVTATTAAAGDGHATWWGTGTRGTSPYGPTPL